MDRAAAFIRTELQAERIRRRNPPPPPDATSHYFKVNDWVKVKNHRRNKFEFDWKGPYYVVSLGHPGTYRLMEPSGRRLPSVVNQADLAPWLHPTQPGVSFFYGPPTRSMVFQDAPPQGRRAPDASPRTLGREDPDFGPTLVERPDDSLPSGTNSSNENRLANVGPLPSDDEDPSDYKDMPSASPSASVAPRDVQVDHPTFGQQSRLIYPSISNAPSRPGLPISLPGNPSGMSPNLVDKNSRA
jgi:hypothetical protein